jgi:hypothetical protein
VIERFLRRIGGTLTLLVLAVAAVIALTGTAAYAGDTPTGYWYGSDGSGPAPQGTGVEYTMPNCGGAYGSYTGQLNQVSSPYNVASDSNAANANQASGYGVGSQNSFMIAPPQSDPSYNGTATEATFWGESQGNAAMENWGSFYGQSGINLPSNPIIYADLENSQYTWNSGTTSLNRDVFNGFWNEVHQKLVSIKGTQREIYAGVYATANFWSNYMTGTLGGTYEWTAQTSYGSYSSGNCASGWKSPVGYIADFYAGYNQNSACAVAWQWISGKADYDQVNGSQIVSGQGGACN